jgi:hypothetical protein
MAILAKVAANKLPDSTRQTVREWSQCLTAKAVGSKTQVFLSNTANPSGEAFRSLHPKSIEYALWQ